MKKTLQIARLELSLLFYSPIAWLLMIVLFFQVSYGFIQTIESLERAQSWYKIFDSFITSKTFTRSGQGVLNNLLSTLYLYIPLITMSLISRETSSGTIKLLYSSPLKIAEIVFGKFIAMMAYNLVLIGLMIVVLTGGVFSIEHFAYQQMITALLGIYLLLCAYAAIGLFMSSLTTYQVVAAVSTFMVFAFLSYVGSFWQRYDILRDITYSLSMPGRTLKMLNGLLTTRDVMYFIVIIGLFIAFTINKLSMARAARSRMFQIGSYILIIVIALTVTYVTSRQQFIGYYDATPTQRNTLSETTRNLLKEMGDEPIEITEYVNLYDGFGKASPAMRISEQDRWEPYLRFKPNIKLNWVYYYDREYDPVFFTGDNKGKTFKQIAEKMVNYFEEDFSNFKTPEEMHKMINLKDEDYRLVMQVKYKGKTNFLRSFQDMEYWPGETEIATVLKRFMVNKVPKVLFVNDGYERSFNRIGDTHYKLFANNKSSRQALVNLGFDVDSISLKTEEIPQDLAALVIADRRIAFEPAMLSKIQKYVDAGGNLFIAAEESKREVNNQLLNLFGVKMMDGIIVQPTKDFTIDKVTAKLASGARAFSPRYAQVGDEALPILMPGVSGLSYREDLGFKVTPLLVTDAARSWNKKGTVVKDSANVTFDTAGGDQHGSFPTALYLTRNAAGKEQRILVASDADFLSNGKLYPGEILDDNVNFPRAAFGWFVKNEFPIDISFLGSEDNAITLNESQIKVMKIIYLWFIPGLMLAMGTILLIRRKRK